MTTGWRAGRPSCCRSWPTPNSTSRSWRTCSRCRNSGSPALTDASPPAEPPALPGKSSSAGPPRRRAAPLAALLLLAFVWPGILRGPRAATNVSSPNQSKAVTSGADVPTVIGGVNGAPDDNHGQPARPGAAGVLSSLPPVVTGSQPAPASAQPSVYYTLPPSTAPTSSPTQPTSTPSPSSSQSRTTSPTPSPSTSTPTPSASASSSTPTPTLLTSTPTPLPPRRPPRRRPRRAHPRPRRRRAHLPPAGAHRFGVVLVADFGVARGVVDGSAVGVSHDLVPTCPRAEVTTCAGPRPRPGRAPGPG